MAPGANGPGDGLSCSNDNLINAGGASPSGCSAGIQDEPMDGVRTVWSRGRQSARS